MTIPGQWPRVKEIVGAALECEPGKLEAYLDDACAEDELLRSEVDSLIAAYNGSANLSTHAWDNALNEGAEVPRTIGPYQLDRLLGAGGMGEVWLAEQSEPVRRQVAIKLVRAGLYDPQVVQRFLAERQSLAMMNHPAIAKIFDAGATPSGQPYLVMEYVDGCPITEYCDRNKLAIADRLRLFQLVCQGVQHAHQKAIIHRDLKPSNILVTEVDSKPMPRIIDFGVAKVSRSLDAGAMFTQAGSVIGTLGYMSPEQADSGGEDIDTRSDIYSLGVVLYELLVGSLPHDFNRLTYYEALRQMREQDAPRPSTRLRTLGDATLSQNRSTETALLVRTLRGDADAITLKTLEKDRTRRYATPSDLAADIEHYLRNEPVTAHSPSIGYRARKYVRRHRVRVIVATAAILLLLGFAVVQTLQLRNTRRERDRADRITGFMINMFKVPDPSEARGSTVTAREILDKSSNEVERGLGFDATVQSQLMGVMAETYMGLGLYARAHNLVERALQSRMHTLGSRNPKTLESMTQMAAILDRESRDSEAEALMHKTVDLETSILGPEHPLTLKTQDDLASILNRSAHYIEAEKLERKIIAIEIRRLGPENPQTYRSRNTLASALKGQNRFEEAEKESRELLESERRTLGIGHPYLLVTMHNLANLLADQGRHDEAEVVYRETLKIERQVLGPEHPDTASTMTTLANTVVNTPGRKAEAQALYRQSLAIELRTLGPDHTYTTHAQEGLANELSSEHRYAEAEQLLRETLSTRQRTLGSDNTDSLLTQYNLSEVMFHEHRFPEAEKMIASALKTQSRVLDANDPDTMASKTLLAKILVGQKRFQEAEVLARQAFNAQLHELGPQHDDTQQSLFVLAEALAHLGRYREAQTLYLTIIARIQTLPKGDPSLAWYNFARVAAGAGQSSEAFHSLHQAVATGYDDVDDLRNDEEWKQLRHDSRFAQALAVVQKRFNAAPQHPQ